MYSVHPITATETAGHDEMAVYILPPSQEASGMTLKMCGKRTKPVSGIV
jgi:hypothetical protein